MTRSRGSGSITARKDGRFQVSVMRRGRRMYRYARSRELAEQRLADLLARQERGRTDGLRAHTRRIRAEDWIGQLLVVARAQSWDDAQLVKVIVAQLSPRRVKRGIFGPCHYCSSWTAATIDHVIPLDRGGPDDDSNLVSACGSCNSRKGARTADEWQNAPRQQPF